MHSTSEHLLIKETLGDFKREIDNNLIIVWDFILHFQQWLDHSNRKSIMKH